MTTALLTRAMAWQRTYRPFTGWLRGADVRPVAVPTDPVAGAEAELVCLRADIATADGVLPRQLVRWLAAQRSWLAKVRCSPGARYEEALRACVWLAEGAEDWAAGTAYVREYLSRYPATGPATSDRDRRIAGLADRYGVGQAVAGGQPNGCDGPGADAPPTWWTPEPAVVEAALERAARAHARASAAVRGLTGCSCPPLPERPADVPALVAQLLHRCGMPISAGIPDIEVRAGGQATRLLAAHAFFRPLADGRGQLFLGPRFASGPPTDSRARLVYLLVLAHETVPGHALQHANTDPALLPFGSVLVDPAGSEGWALWAERSIGALCPHLAEIAAWFRVKRLLPVVVADVRRARGTAAAQHVLDRLVRVSPDYFTSAPPGEQARFANRAYVDGLLATESALDVVRAQGQPWPTALAAYLRAGPLHPDLAVELAIANLRRGGTNAH